MFDEFELLNEGISHIEDLSIENFIKRIENLSNLIVSEKLDGANLWAGFDVNGNFYTSRAGKKKTAKPFYKIDDYPNISAYSGFKAAHLALEKAKGKLSKYIKPGQAVEIEILFGRQPNAVTYGMDDKSYIAFIRPVEGDGDTKCSDDDIENLTNSLVSDEIKVFAEILTSSDGTRLVAEKTPITWKIVKTHTLDAKELKSINVKKELAGLKRYLGSTNADASELDMDLTNAAVLGISLTKVPVSKREKMKEIRTQVSDHVLNTFKLPIKEKLLNDFVRKLKPKLQGTDLDHSEDTGVEGVVARDPDTGEMFKIVDKDVFTTINTFNWGARAAVDGVVRTDDPTSAPEMRGGAVGQSKIRIANLLGMRELAKSSTARRYLEKFKGTNEYDTAQKVADNMSDLNFSSVKTKIRAILTAALGEVGDMLRKFKKEVGTYEVDLKSGKKVGYSPEIKRRTLTAFAEVRKDISEMIEKIDKAPNFTAVLLVLYDRTFKAMFDENLNESFKYTHLKIKEPKPATPIASNLSILLKMSHDDVCQAYQATLLGTLLLLRVMDKPALRMLKDPTHMNLRKYDESMSPLNFWGMVLYNPDVKDIKPYLDPTVAKQLWKTGHRFMTSRIKNIHHTLSTQKDFIVDWDDQLENIRVVTLRLESRTPNVNLVTAGLVHWPDLTLGEKESVVTKIFYMLTQHVPNSPLISRVREAANRLLLTANKDTVVNPGNINVQDVNKIKKLKEDESLAGDGGTVAIAPSTGFASSDGSMGAGAISGFPMMKSITSMTDISSNQKRLWKNKVIIRRKRGYIAPKEFERSRNIKGETKNG
jgi:hypothetical protein